jgi:hypothetical protein
MTTTPRRDFTRLVHIAIGQLKKASFFVIISPRYLVMHSHGEVPEWLNGAVSKTVVALLGHPGFESQPLRHVGQVNGLPYFCWVREFHESHE